MIEIYRISIGSRPWPNMRMARNHRKFRRVRRLAEVARFAGYRKVLATLKGTVQVLVRVPMVFKMATRTPRGRLKLVLCQGPR